MKRVVVKSVFETFEYVIQHYYPAGRRKRRGGQILTLSFPYGIPTQEDLALHTHHQEEQKGRYDSDIAMQDSHVQE